MREILFKAKRICDGKWVEGYYLRDQYHIGGKDIIFYRKDSDRFTVYTDRIDIETICQFTGLCDKNGKKIWEGDIISYQRDNDDCPFPNKDTKKRFGKVFYQGFRSTFAIGMGRNGSRFINDDLWKYVQNGNRVEVIGNRFDSPELLQEESDE